MQKQKNNKKMFFLMIFLTILSFTIIGIFMIFIWKNIVSKSNVQNPDIQTNVDVVKEIFPGLKGIDSVYWEVDNFSFDSRVPGPTDLQYKGLIILEEESANKYMNDYEWKEVCIDFSTKYIDVSEYQDEVWYYSDSFKKNVISSTMIGKIYFNGKVMWFEVSQY